MNSATCATASTCTLQAVLVVLCDVASEERNTTAQANLCVLSAATVAQVTCATHGQSSHLAKSKMARSDWTCCLSVDQCSLVKGLQARAVAEVHAAGYRSPRSLTLTIVLEVHVASDHSLSFARTSTVREAISLGHIERKVARDGTGHVMRWWREE